MSGWTSQPPTRPGEYQTRKSYPTGFGPIENVTVVVSEGIALTRRDPKSWWSVSGPYYAGNIWREAAAPKEGR